MFFHAKFHIDRVNHVALEGQKFPKFERVYTTTNFPMHIPRYLMLSSRWGGRSFGHNRHGPRIRTQAKPAVVNFESVGCCAPFHGGALFPSNTACPGPRPTCVL